ncbi:Coatomer subunit delta [Aphelenchoides fujianensis]|nr:Coatomer subunit delta [Aphelenchoides fujianensis]
MVLITAAVFTKGGKLLLSRQFVSEMTRARLEGLLDAFPKLVSAEKGQRQHTFIETDSVRYVYQPLDQIYMCLVTTKTSNILEDLETLRLFARIIPEYCRSNEESEILANAFELIFAFDEVVALGHRENVNLAQIRTFTEMDSHEERVFNQIQIVVATVKRDGVLESAEIIGSVNLNITDPALNTVVIHAQNADKSGAQLQVHPHLDKAAWTGQSVLRLKNPQKPFPVNRDVDILKWRVQLKEEAALPITLTVWPNEASNGCTNLLLWTIPSVDEANKSGALEFEVPNGDSDHFFPVHLSDMPADLAAAHRLLDGLVARHAEERAVEEADRRTGARQLHDALVACPPSQQMKQEAAVAAVHAAAVEEDGVPEENVRTAVPTTDDHTRRGVASLPRLDEPSVLSHSPNSFWPPLHGE